MKKITERCTYKSQTIKESNYNFETLSLIIKFLDGISYEYLGVSEMAYESFSRADSIGKSFTRLIRFNYKGKKIEIENEIN